MLQPWGCTNSTGSSMVTMWPRVLLLRCATIAASVVDLPAPVAPTTNTRPRLSSARSARESGSCSASSVGMVALTRRSTLALQVCCTKADTRNRPIPGGAMAKLHSLVASYSIAWRSFMTARTSTEASSGVSAGSDCAHNWPSILMAGAKPAVMNKSEPRSSTTRRSSWCISLVAWSRSMAALQPQG